MGLYACFVNNPSCHRAPKAASAMKTLLYIRHVVFNILISPFWSDEVEELLCEHRSASGQSRSRTQVHSIKLPVTAVECSLVQ